MSLIILLLSKSRQLTRISKAFRNNQYLDIESSKIPNITRSIYTSEQRYSQQPIDDYVDIKIDQQSDTTYVEGIPVKPTGVSLDVNKESESCVLCRLNLRNLDYTDVLIISQFIKRDGSLATYHESKLCSKQYRKVVDLIKKAQRCNLIQRPADYLVPGPWHDLNTYIERDRMRDQPCKVIKKQYWKI